MSENSNQPVMGRVYSLESFGSVDGPGVRFVIFLQGCAMRCKFCHNADSWDMQKGDLYSSDELLKKALRFRSYWAEKGGITISGGEPLLQMDFLLDFCKKAKAEGVDITIDSSGNPFTRKEPFFSKFQELMNYVDLFLLDIKEIDDETHKDLTGCSNGNILDMAQYLSEIGKPVWIRHVLVPEYSDKDEDLKKLDAFIKTLKNVERVEVLPYHTLGLFKWQKLGIPYSLADAVPPTDEQVRRAEELLMVDRYPG